MSPRLRTASALLLLVLAASCAPPRKSKALGREDLFSLGYGTAETELNLFSPASERFDAYMREGIFALLDPGSRKILKLTSYGDLLSLYYDPRSADAPKALAPGGPSAKEAGPARGRTAFAASFVEPSRLALDSGQRLYVADRLQDPAARVHDSSSGAWCDRVVRRLEPSGGESPYLGQEGPGGTPFPFVLSLNILEDDSLAVVSASESVFLVHRFAATGELLSAMRLARAALPLPTALKAAGGAAVYANLDALVPTLGPGGFEVLLKVDYYRSASAEKGLTGGGAAYAGSWVLGVDGKTGTYTSSLELSPGGEGQPMPELLGIRKGSLVLVERGAAAPLAGGAAAPPRWNLKLVSRAGRVEGSYGLELPEGSLELAALKLSPGGEVFGLSRREKDMAAFWWRLGR